MRSNFVRILSPFILTSVFLSSLFVAPALATNQSPIDTSFGSNGLSISEIPLQRSQSQAMDVLSNGTGDLFVLYAADPNGSPTVTIGKYTNNGAAVTQYGVNGRTTPIKISGANFEIQADGKIVLAGFQYSDNQTKIVVYRFLTTGVIDTTFGSNGELRIPSFPGKGFSGSEVLLAYNPTNMLVHLGFTVNNTDNLNTNFYFITLDSSGQVDYSWGNGGAREVVPRATGASAWSSLTSLKVLSDGSVIGIGSAFSTYTKQIVLTKINSNGYLDANFDGASNGNGVVFIQFGSESDAYMTATTVLQNDDLVLAGIAGTYYSGPMYYGVTKILASGLVDTSFGASGFKLSSTTATYEGPLPRRLGIQSDGRYVFSINSGTTAGFMRVETNGTFSNTPNCSQCVWSGANDGAISSSLAVQADNKIVIVGALRTEKNAIVRRFTAAGISDGTFNDSLVTFDCEHWEPSIYASHVLPNNSILVFGSASTSRGYNNISRILVMKYNSVGTLDTSFGLGGYQFLAPPSDSYSAHFSSFIVHSDGKIAVLASGRNNGNTEMFLWRLNSNGLLDNSFGTNGNVAINDGSADLSPRALLFSPSGKYLVAFTRYVSWVGSPWLYRYTSSGLLDASINPYIGDGDGSISAAIQDEAGRTYLAGVASFNGQSKTFVTRLLSDGTADTSYSSGFRTWDSQHLTLPAWMSKIFLDSANRLVILGATDANTPIISIVRLNMDGTFDTSFNGTGHRTLFLKDPNLIHYNDGNDIIASEDGYVVVGGGDSDPRNNYTVKFSGIARFHSNGSFNQNFATDGILLPFAPKETYFNSVNSLSDGSFLIVGEAIEQNVQKIVMAKIFPTNQVPGTTTPPTTASVPTVPPTTSPSTTIAPVLATNEGLLLVISVSQVSILKQLKWTPAKGSKIVLSISPSSKKVCRASKTKVIGMSSGTCRVTVSATVKGKTTKRQLSFKVT